MADKTIRLTSKILRELNISLNRAVEFLKEKNIQIEYRLNTKISQVAYEVLLLGFETDRGKKIKSQKIAIEKKKEKEKILQEQKNKTPETATEHIKTKKEKIALKTVGKIDITPKKNKKQEKAPQGKSKKPSIKKDVPSKKELEYQPKNRAVITEKQEETEAIKTKYQKLGGVKNTGQVIDLKSFERPKKKKEDKKAVNTKKDDKARKKRPRIQKNKPFDKKRNHKKRVDFIKKELISDQASQKMVRETLKQLENKKSKKGAKYRREKRDLHRKKIYENLDQQEAENKILKITEFATPADIVAMMNNPKITVSNVISTCMSIGLMVSINQRLDQETITLVAEDFGYEVNFVGEEIDEESEDQEVVETNLQPRAPIVTVMGHVDHGKTSLLDYIRKTNVIAGESGGITQHIGAYSVTVNNGKKITFFDTPGHEAFTAMRARGTQLTDLAVIVIAADDDIMPQTKEAINHAKAAGVPMVFAINKIDKQGANPDKIKEKLAQMDLLVEDWGGKVQSQDISAKKGMGIDELLEKILLEAELLELKANPDKLGVGTVVEAMLKSGSGYVSTVLVQAGTLRMGDYILTGRYSGKVRAMFDERSNRLKEAGPSTPVSLLGLDGAPQAGDKIRVYKDEREAKKIANKRSQLQREQTIRTQKKLTLDEIGKRIAVGNFSELNLIIKGDVDGSVEALTGALQNISTNEININIIHKAVGDITESDVQLATASSNTIIIGFSVNNAPGVKQLAEKSEIEIKNYGIIFEAIEDVKNAMEGMLSPEIKEEILGNVEIRVVYKISKVGNIAGCMVTRGKIQRNALVRVVREGTTVHRGKVSALKRFKEDVKEVVKGYECGVQVSDFDDIKEGDILEVYKEVAVRRKL